jgi:hypothetical protein
VNTSGRRENGLGIASLITSLVAGCAVLLVLATYGLASYVLYLPEDSMLREVSEDSPGLAIILLEVLLLGIVGNLAALVLRLVGMLLQGNRRPALLGFLLSAGALAATLFLWVVPPFMHT